jgi:hypothetical protein
MNRRRKNSKAKRRDVAVSEFRRLRAKMVRRAQLQGVNTDDEVFGALYLPRS